MTRPLAVLALATFLVTLAVSPAAAQFTFTGGSNGILGIYLSAGKILRMTPWTTLTLGATYSETLGVEPLVALALTRPLPRGWNSYFTASYGALGGDYRVERLPEIVLAKGDRVPGSKLNYGLEVGAGNYRVRPNEINGYRLHAVVQLTTPSYALGRTVSASAGVGYRQYVYASSQHAASWATAGITLAPSPAFSATLSYLRQIPSGASPLLFDAIGQENTLTGGLTVRPAQTVTFTHSQSYSFTSRTITARVFGVSVAIPGGPTISLSYDDVPKTASVHFSW